MPASQATIVGFWPYSVISLTSMEAKPKIAFVGCPREVAIVSGRAKNARYTRLLPSIRKSSRAEFVSKGRETVMERGRENGRGGRPERAAGGSGGGSPRWVTSADPMAAPSAQFSLILRVELPHESGTLGRVTAAITKAGGSVGAADTMEARGSCALREITIDCESQDHRGKVIKALQAVREAKLIETIDRTFEVHRGGKIFTGLAAAVKTRDDLSMAYTPGVARVCSAIAENRQKAFKYTIKANTVAVVSDGTAVLGLGDIGPEAAMPVMEGKAMLFKEFGGVDAFPICLDTKDPDRIVDTVKLLAPTFGGINLEDISSPRCFEIEQRLIRELDIPVFHDDQHGTAIVVLAALINACRLTDRKIEDLAVVIVGAGAAGVAVSKILMNSGITRVVACDRSGAIHSGRLDYESGAMNAPKTWLAENTNEEGRSGSPTDVLEGADLFIGLSGPGIISAADLDRMN